MSGQAPDIRGIGEDRDLDEMNRFRYELSLRDGLRFFDSKGRLLLQSDGGSNLVKNTFKGAVGDGFPLKNPDGEVVLNIKQGSVRDRISGNSFSVNGSPNSEPVVDYEIPRAVTSHKVNAYDPEDGKLLLRVVNDDLLSAVVRESPLRRLFPGTYDIQTPEEQTIGTIEVESLTGTYKLTMDMNEEEPITNALLLIPPIILFDLN